MDQASEQQRTFSVQDYLHEILTRLKPKLKNTGYQVPIQCEKTIKLTTYPGTFL